MTQAIDISSIVLKWGPRLPFLARVDFPAVRYTIIQ